MTRKQTVLDLIQRKDHGVIYDTDDMEAITEIDFEQLHSDEAGEVLLIITGTFKQKIIKYVRATYEQPEEIDVEEAGELSVEVAVLDKDGEELDYFEIYEDNFKM